MFKLCIAVITLTISSAVIANPNDNDQHSTADSGPKSNALAAEQWYRNVYAPAFIKGSDNFLDFYEKYIFAGFGDHPGYYLKDQYMAMLEKTYIQPWTKAGWVSSELVNATSSPVGKSAALITAVWRLKTKDGAAVLKCTLPSWQYLVTRQHDDWLVISEFEAPCAVNGDRRPGATDRRSGS